MLEQVLPEAEVRPLETGMGRSSKPSCRAYRDCVLLFMSLGFVDTGVRTANATRLCLLPFIAFSLRCLAE
jgi:hypothetical protein